jgi:DNA-directed RNA polymerase specialized sigma24 family protein
VALENLSERQRLAVILVHGYGWRPVEVAAVTGLRTTTVQTHAARGLARLRDALEASSHA